ncbi:MAG TPA: heavy metal translocating P-type ATPase, partial [Sporosarcina sp.]|nr:heavy metal translocating P-type ATPase [Sporosarcina sp.]
MAFEKQAEYRLQNLSCANCAIKFEKNIRELPEVSDVTVNFGASKLLVKGSATVEELEAAGAFDGIKVIPAAEKRVEEQTPFFKRRENIVTLLSLVFLLIGTYVSFRYAEHHPAAIALFAVSIAIGGASMFKSGLQNLVRLDFDMKTLMTIAVIGAAIIGEWREGAVVVFLFAVSEALEAYSMNKARQSIKQLMDIAPSTATVLRDGNQVELDTEDIVIGDTLLVKPGQKIAMDGIVRTGMSSINEAPITGESMPAPKTVGDEVFAGTVNEEGALEIEVTKLVGDTTIAKIIHLVEEAQAEKAPTQKFVDRFAKYYTPIIIGIAFLVAIVPPLFTGDWHTWVYQGLAVLVVGCPCALVVSTPVAIVTAIGNAARHGVLIKGGVHLEQAGRIKAIAFDKTGTLTKGYPDVTNVVSLNGMDEKELISIAAAVESMSQHPLAKAILSYSKRIGAPIKEATNFQSVTGKGAYATVEGVTVSIGSIDWMEELGDVPGTLRESSTSLQAEGKTVVAVALDGVLAGIIGISDPIRSTSASVLEKLKNIGVRQTIMLTGDNPKTAQAIAEKLGVTDVRAKLMPQDKLSAILHMRQQYGTVAMVGDGINDAPALAAADVGIAMGGAGTDAALETADIALMADDLEKLPYTIKLSRKALRIIKENIMFALGLKIVALLLI